MAFDNNPKKGTPEAKEKGRRATEAREKKKAERLAKRDEAIAILNTAIRPVNANDMLDELRNGLWAYVNAKKGGLMAWLVELGQERQSLLQQMFMQILPTPGKEQGGKSLEEVGREGLGRSLEQLEEYMKEVGKTGGPSGAT